MENVSDEMKKLEIVCVAEKEKCKALQKVQVYGNADSERVMNIEFAYYIDRKRLNWSMCITRNGPTLNRRKESWKYLMFLLKAK